ncbi:S24 family peptidase [Komagataeibacter sp. FNDCR1]|nr:S24 family peptidase [Komagataeibacter sp. FNDCR1]
MMGTGYSGENTTGFASPAGDSIEGTIDLAEVLELRRPSRFPVRVDGEALLKRGVHRGDILVVDTAAGLTDGCLVVAAVSGEMRVCIARKSRAGWKLSCSIRQDSEVLESDPIGNVVVDGDVTIWGVVTGLVRETP